MKKFLAPVIMTFLSRNVSLLANNAFPIADRGKALCGIVMGENAHPTAVKRWFRVPSIISPRPQSLRAFTLIERAPSKDWEVVV